MEHDEHVGQLLTADGVTAVRWRRTGPREWSNLDPVTMRAGDVLEVGTIAITLQPDAAGPITVTFD